MLRPLSLFPGPISALSMFSRPRCAPAPPYPAPPSKPPGPLESDRTRKLPGYNSTVVPGSSLVTGASANTTFSRLPTRPSPNSLRIASWIAYARGV